ncbi:MAG TPA: metalloregulator ArsR/SmtB family transcription factor [Pyrinomonadaceae bacterium]|nr:metalloregulator ArsR/SmtB family transcription factor [Pyrinomonadaceae bacterium]
MSRAARKFDMEMFFRALADRTRLRLLNLMGTDEVCVCFFVEILEVNQPKVSRHLAYLRRAGIAAARREGTWMHYRVVGPSHEDAAKVLEDVRAWLARDPEMRRERKKLVKVCCAPDPPEHLLGAPRPASISTCRGGQS